MPRAPAEARVGTPEVPRSAWPWVLWLGALALATAGMLGVRATLDKAHVAMVYLLLVLGASARGGRAVGLTLAVVAFLSLNFFFVAPYHTLVVAEPLDWLVLVAFLVTSAVAAQLLARARSEAAAARQRADEVNRIAAIGAEALNAGRAEEALTAIADVIRATLGAGQCEIFLRDGPRDATVRRAAHSGDASLAADAREGGLVATLEEVDQPGFRLPLGSPLVQWVASSGRAAVERADGTLRVGTDARDGAGGLLALGEARTVVLPLRVGARVAGVLRLAGTGPLPLDAPRRRVLEALSYYAALGVERVRLVAEAEHAEALQQADALKDALLASVSHDLRTPLTTIKALAQDIRTGGDERAAVIEEEADRLNRFVADLLDLSRLAGGALVLAPEITAVEDLVGAALQRVSGTPRGRDDAVSLDPREPLLLGRFDFVHSLRIVVNLLENALKYSPAGTTVELAARRADGVVEIVVADRGAGVPVAARDRIFEAFYRPEGTAPDVGGAGLGLSIARRLAEAQGGTLHHEAREGGGSRFVLRLPGADLSELPGGVADGSS